jgi:hypothetical protein
MNTDVLKSNMLSLASGPMPTLPNPCDTIPGGKQILFFEAYQESGDAFTDERISFDQNSAAMMRYWTNWDAISDPALAQILRTTLVGGWYEPTGEKITPHQHPYIPGLYCKDIVSVQSVACGPQDFAGIRTPIPFQLGLLTLSYTSRPYDMGAETAYDNANLYNPNWVEVRIKQTNQHSNFGFAIWAFDSDNLPATLGNFVTSGISYITCIFHDIPDSLLYSGNGLAPKTVFQDDLGKVNSTTLFGMTRWTILADSADIEPYGDYFDPAINHNTVTINFIYNSIGWNKTARYNGTYENIHYVGDASQKPYNEVNFLQAFFNRINPP